MLKIGNDWDSLLAKKFDKDEYKTLCNFLDSAYNGSKKVYPPNRNDVFKALRATSYKETKVVILGQDPYYNEGQADGLAFSLPCGVPIPPGDSLDNIFKMICKDKGITFSMPDNGCLLPWAKQGVLLLNTALTVIHRTAKSHLVNWKNFTDWILKELNEKDLPVVFLLWGYKAKAKEKILKRGISWDEWRKAKGKTAGQNKHLILKAPHPKPRRAQLQEQFFNCQHFSQTNTFLEYNGLPAIDWQIPNVN